MNKKILKLALPNILSNISVPLLSTVDVALMGRFSILHLGAIGIAAMIFNFFFWNFGFLRMGTTGMVAQAYGAHDAEEIKQVLSKSVYVSLMIAIVLIMLQVPIGHAAMYLLGVTTDHSLLVWQYFNIRIWSAPATLLTYSLFGWFFGMQNSVVPMVATIVTNIVNILLSYLLVIEFNYGIEGVAYGTVIAEYLGVLILLYFVARKYNMSLAPFRGLNGWKRFLVINRDLFVRTIALTSAFAFFYRQSSLSGELILAANVVMLQFLSWMSYGIDGFAYASESLVGRFFGENKSRDLLKVVRLSFVWGLGLAILFSVLFGFYSTEIAYLFTKEADVLNLIQEYQLWLLMLPIIAFVSYIWDGIYIGLTNTKLMRNSMIYSLLIYLLLFAALQAYMENAIWVAFLAFLLLRGAFLTYFWMMNKSSFLPFITNK